jgi:flagellar export protein FliJ
MNAERTIVSLSRLVELRARERDRLGVELADKEALRARYRRNLQRMDELMTGLGQSGTTNLALSVNCGDVKASLLDTIHAHRNDLGRHEAEIEATRRALASASLRHEALERSLLRKRHALAVAGEKRDQKRQDQLASQAWHRTRRDAASAYPIPSEEGSP